MVKGIYGNAEIAGNILDIATGRTTGVELQLTLRKGINNTISTILDTYILESDGKYSFHVPAGNYTITVEDKRKVIGDNERYHTITLNIAALADKTVTQDGYVSQAIWILIYLDLQETAVTDSIHILQIKSIGTTVRFMRIWT